MLVARVRLPGAGRGGPGPPECVELADGATSGNRTPRAGVLLPYMLVAFFLALVAYLVSSVLAAIHGPARPD